MCEVRITKLRTGYRVRKKVSRLTTNATVVGSSVLGREKSVEKNKKKGSRSLTKLL